MELIWKDCGYNIHRLTIPGGFQITVSWDGDDGYRVTFERSTLIRRYTSLPEAKQAGRLLAQRKLEAALKCFTESFRDEDTEEAL